MERLQFILKLLSKTAERGVAFKLTQSVRFRPLVPAWVYDEVQRDTAEYIQQLLQAQQLHSTIWDSRCLGLAGFQLRAQGDARIPMQDVIHHWNTRSDVHAMAHPSDCLCLQLNRYVRYGRHGKIMQPIRFDRPVYFPRFIEHVRLAWDQYIAIAAVIHIGRTTQGGHYRALLKVGAQWMYTDDSSYVQPVTVNAEHESNVYVIWLKRC